jgi:hypothetical protein
MSYVTEVVVLGAEDDDMARLNGALANVETARGQVFNKVPEAAMEMAGGFKVFTASMWAAAFSYFGSDGEIESLVADVWDDWSHEGILVAACTEGSAWRVVFGT